MMTTAKPRSLRQILWSTAAVVFLLTIVIAGTLVSITTLLRRATTDVAAAVESVRLIDAVEVDLLLHARARDPIVRQELAGQLRSATESARAHVTSENEAKALREVDSGLAEYLTSADSSDASAVDVASRQASAYEALERLGEINVAQAREAREAAVGWDQVANAIGICLGVSILIVVTLLIQWLRRRVIRPLFAFADTIRRFGEGERTARAIERGPLELRDMSRRFNEMATTIATQREAQTTFLGGVAHDLRTPLSALRLAVDIVDPREPLPPEPELRRMLAIVSRQIQHLDRMVGDFLDMSKIEAGKLDLDVEYRDLARIVGDTVALYDQAAKTPGRFHLTVPREATTVLCDDVRIGQVISNLLSNAVKYSPGTEEIEVTVRTDHDDAVIEVTDHGAGISREDHQRIFQPFDRAGIKHRVSGTGLGLFNVRRIVEAHGGSIEVESAPNRGSTFRIRLRRTWQPQTSALDRPPAHEHGSALV